MGAGEEGGGQRSVAGSRAARTARRSAWAATDVFSDDDDEGGADGETKTRGARTGRATTAAPSQRGAGQDRRGGKRGAAGEAARLPGGRGGNDPVDLLDAGTNPACSSCGVASVPRQRCTHSAL